MTQKEFAERIGSMQTTLYRVSRSILPQLCDCEDAVQSAILKAWRQINHLRDDDKLQSWLIRIVIHECYALLKKRRREVPTLVLPEKAVPLGADPDLYRFFAALPEKIRMVMVLYYVEGYDISGIAEILRLPRGTVKSRLSRGRERMRQENYMEEVEEL